MAHSQKTTEEMAEALRQAGGIVSDAARLLGVTRQAVNQRLVKEKELQEAQEEGEEMLDDLAERTVGLALRKAPWKDRLTAARMRLGRKKAGKRGYNTVKVGIGGGAEGDEPVPGELTITFKA